MSSKQTGNGFNTSAKAYSTIIGGGGGEELYLSKSSLLRAPTTILGEKVMLPKSGVNIYGFLWLTALTAI